MKESVIEQYLVDRVKQKGGEVRKVKWIGRRHAPDRVVMLPDIQAWGLEIPSTIWVELKAPGEKPRPGQVREHERMRACGQLVVVIDSIEGVDDLLCRD